MCVVGMGRLPFLLSSFSFDRAPVVFLQAVQLYHPLYLMSLRQKETKKQWSPPVKAPSGRVGYIPASSFLIPSPVNEQLFGLDMALRELMLWRRLLRYFGTFGCPLSA